MEWAHQELCKVRRGTHPGVLVKNGSELSDEEQEWFYRMGHRVVQSLWTALTNSGADLSLLGDSVQDVAVIGNATRLTGFLPDFSPRRSIYSCLVQFESNGVRYLPTFDLLDSSRPRGVCYSGLEPFRRAQGEIAILVQMKEGSEQALVPEPLYSPRAFLAALHTIRSAFDGESQTFPASELFRRLMQCGREFDSQAVPDEFRILMRPREPSQWEQSGRARHRRREAPDAREAVGRLGFRDPATGETFAVVASLDRPICYPRFAIELPDWSDGSDEEWGGLGVG